MLSRRIIATILCRGRTVVKGKRFGADRVAGGLLETIEVFNLRGADEIILWDIDARKEGRCFDTRTLSEIAEHNFYPLAVGGGIRSVADARALLSSGADKVTLGSGFDLFEPIAKEFGSQAAVAVIDYHQGEDVAQRCAEAVKWAGEIILQCVDRDGELNGYDTETARRLALPVPVVLSCGAGTYEHLVEGLEVADAVSAGAMWLYTDATFREAKEYIKTKGYPVRV